MGAHDISVPWHRFLVAYRAGDDATALAELQAYIRTWDEAFWADDFSSFASVYTADVELHNSTRLQNLISPGDLQGIAGFSTIREEIIGAARFFRFDIERFERASGERLVALGKVRARSRTVGLVIRLGFAAIWTLSGDMICRAEGFTSHRAALKTAGLSPRGRIGDESDGENVFLYDDSVRKDLGD